MKVWVVTIGEPLPIDGAEERLHRSGLLCDLMAAKGDDVVWWTSSFDHFRKRHRVGEDQDLQLRPNYQIRMLRSTGYKRNVSLARMQDHGLLAWRMSRQMEREQAPDVILCSLPALELCECVNRFARRRGIPVVLDVRDLWPDAFVPLAPVRLHGVARVALMPMFWLAKRVCSEASALIGITDAFVDWAVENAKRQRTKWDRAFWLAYPRGQFAAEKRVVARSFWTSRHLSPDGSLIVCFFGNLGHQMQAEMSTVLRAAELLAAKGVPCRFVICGSGEKFAEYAGRSQEVPTIILPGRIDRVQIEALMEVASVGVVPYHRQPDFQMSIPNKVGEYLSGGLAVLSSLSGTTGKLIAEQRCGLVYEPCNPFDLAGKVQELVDDPGILAEMRTNAARLYDRCFRTETVYGDLREHLLAITRNRAIQPHVSRDTTTYETFQTVGVTGGKI